MKLNPLLHKILMHVSPEIQNVLYLWEKAESPHPQPRTYCMKAPRVRVGRGREPFPGIFNAHMNYRDSERFFHNHEMQNRLRNNIKRCLVSNKLHFSTSHLEVYVLLSINFVVLADLVVKCRVNPNHLAVGTVFHSSLVI